MSNNDLRSYIDIISESQINDKDQLDEAGLLDKPLAALGGRAAKGRLALKQYYKDLIGDWREYAAEIGLDKSRLFSQNNFPAEEFVEFLKTQQQFDDEMIQAVPGLAAGTTGHPMRGVDVKEIMQKAAEVYAKKVRGTKLKKGEEEPEAEVGAEKAAKAMAGDTAKGSDTDQAATYFKAIGGNLEKAISSAQAIVGNPQRMKKLDHMQRAGLAYLAARGKLKLKK